MRSTKLKVGDIVFLPKGLMVGRHEVPRKLMGHFISPFDNTPTDGHFKLGITYVSREDVFEERIEVRTRIAKIFEEMMIPLNLSILDRFLFHQIREQKPAMLLLPYGHYYVYKTKEELGTRWIYCEEMYGDPPVRIYFWQGDYQGVSELVHNEIVPVRKSR